MCATTAGSTSPKVMEIAGLEVKGSSRPGEVEDRSLGRRLLTRNDKEKQHFSKLL